MNDLILKLKQPSRWTVSVQLLILYVVSVTIFFGAHEIHKKIQAELRGRVAKGEPASVSAVFLSAVVLNFLGAFILVFIAKKVGESARMAMVGLPLFLIGEQHVRRMRAVPEERRLQMIGIIGVTLGLLAAVLAFMPHAPLK